jgi:ribose transport system ATP-binding protein
VVAAPAGAATTAARHDALMTTDPAAIEAINLSRSFGGVHALTDASLIARFGEVHALVGENGAGKSTLIKILGGVVRSETGSIRIGSEDVTLAGPRAARSLGVGTVFQELTLFPWLTVAENLFIGEEPRGRTGLIRRRVLASRAREVFDRFSVSGIDPSRLASSLSLAHRQVVEITSAFLHDPRILLLDEPTSALTEHEVAWLFALVRALRDRGGCVIFTSHRWAEVQALADRITILRNGADVATRERFDEHEAVTLMTGRTIDRLYPDLPPAPSDGEVMLEAEGLESDRLHGVSFELRRGEIVGLAGLAGQGQRELFMSLFGARRLTGGSVRIHGVRRRLRRPADAIKHGLAISFVPEDRKTEGLMLPMSVRDNLTLAILDRIASAGVISHTREVAAVNDVVNRLQIKTRGAAVQEVRELSGGNQQKVLIGRWLLTDPEILLLFDITRGVDVGTKHDIYELAAQLARDGKAILFYSSETEEIAKLCHRVLVIREGRIVAELSGADADAEGIVAAAIRENDP